MIPTPPRSTLFPYTTLFRSTQPPTEVPRRPSPRTAIEVCGSASGTAGSCGMRSEEHTSELQSRENLVCRLLLEKKNRTLSHRLSAFQFTGTRGRRRSRDIDL